MNDSKISVRYAKALFLSALEEKHLESVMKDVELINTSYKVEGFKEILESPVVKTSEKKTLAETVYAKNVSALTMRFLELILTNKREIFLEGILRNFEVMYRKHMGIKKAELIVPYEVSSEYYKKFLDLLEKVFDSKMILSNKINPDIIGGFILKVDDEQFDASISSSLSKIKKNLLENAN